MSQAKKRLQVLQPIESQIIFPQSLPNKDKFYWDIQEIENSFSGRMDFDHIGIFIKEAGQLLLNAISLFEKGYFDCAYYSLRSAVDVATTLVYFVDMPEEERNVKFSAWKENDHFPMKGEMIQALLKRGNILRDMKEKMPKFFDDAQKLSEKLNKYVHKQGFQNYYVVREYYFNNKPQDVFIQNFENNLKKCIGVIAVMRLAIDPFPVLLLDDEILCRCPGLVEKPYREDFVKEYIGEKYLEAYKTTEIYKGLYDYYMVQERKNEAVFNVIQYQIIDTSKKEEILSQIHLLGLDDIVCVTIAFACDKAVRLYPQELCELCVYYTDRKSNRINQKSYMKDSQRFSSNENKYNQPDDEVFISVFPFRDINYFVEHNEKLTDSDIETISNELKSLDNTLPSIKNYMEEDL